MHKHFKIGSLSGPLASATPIPTCTKKAATVLVVKTLTVTPRSFKALLTLAATLNQKINK